MKRRVPAILAVSALALGAVQATAPAASAKAVGEDSLAALLTSALFALVHVNLASLPALFYLALCLTLAYEWTGSLLVPITMHALFNTVSLVGLYVTSRTSPG